MPINLGSTSIGSLYLGSTGIDSAYLGSVKIYGSGDPLNPLNLPAKTIRIKFVDGFTPSADYGSATQVSSTAGNNVWDITTPSTSWQYLNDHIGAIDEFSFEDPNTLAVLGANASGITAMNSMFYGSNSLTTVQLFDTSSVTDMSSAFYDCYSLASIPLFNTSSCTNMNYAFHGCTGVESGALALYQQASSQTTPPSNHSSCFYDCGSDTVTGSAELDQIPRSWGGNA
jgi:surface protein